MYTQTHAPTLARSESTNIHKNKYVCVYLCVFIILVLLLAIMKIADKKKGSFLQDFKF